MVSTVRRRSAIGVKAVPVATSAVTVQPRPGTGVEAEMTRPARAVPGVARTTPRWSVTVRRTPWAVA